MHVPTGRLSLSGLEKRDALKKKEDSGSTRELRTGLEKQLIRLMENWGTESEIAFS